jgi:hypothetical protein
MAAAQRPDGYRAAADGCRAAASPRSRQPLPAPALLAVILPGIISQASVFMITKIPHRISCGIFVIMS